MAEQLVYLKEVSEDADGSYVTVWHCPPPADGEGFIVIRDEWTDNYSVRHIYELA